jgi:hypothetical protein
MVCQRALGHHHRDLSAKMLFIKVERLLAIRRCSRNLHFDLYSAVQNSVLRFVTSKSLVAHTRAK